MSTQYNDLPFLRNEKLSCQAVLKAAECARVGDSGWGPGRDIQLRVLRRGQNTDNKLLLNAY